MTIEKKLTELMERVNYAREILGNKDRPELDAFAREISEFPDKNNVVADDRAVRALESLEVRLSTMETAIDAQLTAMDKVRIVRHPQRACLKDILENVYDNYTEIGGKDEHSIDPGMLIARAYITRRKGRKLINQPVMVVGQEKGHGQEFRNGGSIKPWGNSKALKYMKVAAREQIPIHAYVNTPGSYPVEDFPGAAQQIAENIYEMAGLPVPIIAIFSEGGSGGAEAIGMADKRLMLSHGYYSVISPEGAAAIEGRIRGSERAPAELIESCAIAQQITAQDNLRNGYIDEIIQEPALGVRADHFDFYKRLRDQVVRATDEVTLSVRGMRLFRAFAMRHFHKHADIIVRWTLTENARERLIQRRFKKYRKLARHAFHDNRSLLEKLNATRSVIVSTTTSAVHYGLIKPFQHKIARIVEEATDEIHVVTGKIDSMYRSTLKKLGVRSIGDRQKEMRLTGLSQTDPQDLCIDNSCDYVSPQARVDREITCPHADKRGCLDIWARDLFTDFSGVCPHCGYNFPMEYQWYLHNVFDKGSVREFNRDIASGNPTGFPGFEKRIEAARAKTGLHSSCMTFNASLEGIRLTCATLIANFRGGSVGAAEGEKFIRALELAQSKHQPFLAYVHGTAGIRIQEGVNGLIQMPRCTMAVRKYIEEGGLYIVLYDTNSYAGPVASFLGCSPYQYAVRSSRLGFAGPGVIKETTGVEIPPDYHNCFKALSRGHIQGVWSRKDIRNNLRQALLTIGGRNLYYR
ncbi:MAG: acetyl-CoA carboxylase carboxyl transferase subunit alpha/beta [Pseudodesulfovibrio sp.]|uniref:Acetyl-coenzyme A carboxylase carboxyl transferase subunits beta/alpha n=1 Tax=Pseudodesulfovibrio aespoeensis (strain ATCC 700646 / DSM 10631 / Aspo-2) TaxID=643562 RepID=E6VW20_PSEA9|nr:MULTISPECIES: carboxyl transferase domain-containing protein [Pseudodesulfovibrio]MBU4378988.1 acetyl-CoA carboxylase carboxyl transferase subunit alpha/beta [Pseudomonadota bacterium]ADU62465.1 Acetyl-CoA carboxylase, alpha subunit, conserved region [Pseudodesulfovibrio aespoeensis Aspo-2]MBU4474562.1 acetyl-CoA carboxylase carboxyl transferase subunit alpha/beta [Pseudomonadota bacterium]MBU4515068.1 acetyl-CoA carboxylase carboxyl transferase subunit alpha/beta [Pseudomonadota bacterium]